MTRNGRLGVTSKWLLIPTDSLWKKKKKKKKKPQQKTQKQKKNLVLAKFTGELAQSNKREGDMCEYGLVSKEVEREELNGIIRSLKPTAINGMASLAELGPCKKRKQIRRKREALKLRSADPTKF